MVRVAMIAGTAQAKPHGLHDAVHQVGDPRHVARVFHQPDEEEEQQDLRQKHHDRTRAADHALHDQLREEAGAEHSGDLLAHEAEYRFDGGDRGIGPSKQRLKHQEVDDQEGKKAPHRMDEDRVGPVGGRAPRGLRDEACDVGVEPGVAPAHDLLIERCARLLIGHGLAHGPA
jgi:hypothetical protein